MDNIDEIEYTRNQITDEETYEETSLDSLNRGEQRSDMNPFLQSIEFLLTCEIAGVKLSINELLELRNGDELPIVTDLQQIRIRVNDVIIGYGEIVKLDDKYGVKINKLLSVFK